MAKDSQLVKNVLDMLRDLGQTRSRAMFGGHGIYHADIMVGLVADGVLYLKVDDQNRPMFEAAGSGPFVYRHRNRKKPTEMSYWEVPTDVLEHSESLCQWAREAYAAACRTRAGASKKAKRRPA